MDINEIKNHIADCVNKVESDSWEKVQISFLFPPYNHAGNKTSHLFLTKDGNVLPIFARFENKFTWTVIMFFYEFCDKIKCNKIVFRAQKGKLAESTIDCEFDQSILDEFLSYLPKSKRGKTIPWYENDESVTKAKEFFNTL